MLTFSPTTKSLITYFYLISKGKQIYKQQSEITYQAMLGFNI